jgi:hypothetical protein
VEAKVDIRKLQLLNDRIAQVTDALNQVRLSVHGLTHTGAIGQPGLGVPFGGQQVPFGIPQATPYGLGQPMGFQHTPYYPGAVPGIPFGQLPWQGGQQSPFLGGLGSPGIPFGQLPWQGGQQSPFSGGFGSAGTPFSQVTPWQTGVQSPMTGPFGLQHTAAYGPSPYGIPPGALQTMGGGWPGGSQSFGAGGPGLYHRPELMEQRLLEQRANDPSSILQTFPFCQAPVSQATW